MIDKKLEIGMKLINQDGKIVYVTGLPHDNYGYFRLAYTKGLSSGSSTWHEISDNICKNYTL